MLDKNSNQKDVENYVKNNLTEEQKSQIKNVLSDKEKLSKLLSSPLAQELLKKFGQK